MPMALHDQKGHVMPHSDHLDLINAMILLIMPYDDSASASGITWPKYHFGAYFNHLNMTKWCNWQCHQCHVVLALVPTASHDQNVMSNLVSITSTLGTKWCHCWCHYHHIAPMLAPVTSHDWHHVAPLFDCNDSECSCYPTDISRHYLDLSRHIKTSLDILYTHLDII